MIRDPHEHNARVSRVAKDTTDEAFLEKLNAALDRSEELAPRERETAAQLPILYVVGLPRSGTTLLCQVMARYLRVGYVDNIIARFWRRPSVGIRLSKLLLGEDARLGISFKSQHGKTAEPAGPHEFGYFWRTWFNVDASKTHHLTSDELAQVDRDGLRTALRAEFLSTFEMPVVFKGVLCGFHAALLSELHPASLFVHIKRDPLANAVSILSARKARYGTYDAWWSLKPSTYPFVPKPADPVEEVLRQMKDVDAEIAAELAKPRVQSIAVNYRDICTDPGAVLEALVARVGLMGEKLERVGGDLPDLTESGGSTLPAEMMERLRASVTGLAGGR